MITTNYKIKGTLGFLWTHEPTLEYEGGVYPNNSSFASLVTKNMYSKDSLEYRSLEKYQMDNGPVEFVHTDIGKEGRKELALCAKRPSPEYQDSYVSSEQARRLLDDETVHDPNKPLSHLEFVGRLLLEYAQVGRAPTFNDIFPRVPKFCDHHKKPLRSCGHCCAAIQYYMNPYAKRFSGTKGTFKRKDERLYPCYADMAQKYNEKSYQERKRRKEMTPEERATDIEVERLGRLSPKRLEDELWEKKVAEKEEQKKIELIQWQRDLDRIWEDSPEEIRGEDLLDQL